MIEDKVTMLPRYEISGAKEVSVFNLQLECISQPVARGPAHGDEDVGQVGARSKIDFRPNAFEVAFGVNWHSVLAGLDVVEAGEKKACAVPQVERNFHTFL